MNGLVSKFVFDRTGLGGLSTDGAAPQTTFSLSFDCDDDRDPESFPWLIDLLGRYRIEASFAVCGAMVEDSADAYRSLVSAGHEIVNHGYVKHSARQGNHIISTLFYDRVPLEFVRDEIRHNHEVVRALLGYEMTGFRVPHFGYFQSSDQVVALFEMLHAQGYRYDSSLTAFSYLKLRKRLRRFPLVELPLSPHPRHPRSTLDSWGYVSTGDPKGLDGFVRDFRQLIDWALSGRHHVNIYVDPSHVFKWAGFEECLALVNERRDRIRIANYAALLSPQVA